MSSALRSLRCLLPATLLAVSVLLASSTASSQGVCFGPDGLTGACCTAVTPNLPGFPQVAVGGLGICWNNCNVSSTQDLRVTWAPPTEVKCTEYVTTITVSDAGTGSAIMSGTLVLDYTRTWDEIAPDGTTRQVWRFAAKADLSSVLPVGVLPPCPLPTCLPPVGPHSTAFFYGYADYACLDPTVTFDPVLVLYHACDKFIHRPGFSDRPGSFHPGGSYAIVAPHTAVQSFTPANMVAPGGPNIGEGSRDMTPGTPPPFVCIAEDPVVAGSMDPLATGCVCNLTPTTVHHTLRKFTGTTACINAAGVSGGWATLAINFPVNPWYHLVTSSIGFWSTPGLYPGNEQAWVDEGIFVHLSACTGDFAELKYGGTTRGGWDVLLPIPVVINEFTDLADNYSAPLFGPYPTPILGSIRPTDHLIYVNYP
jgi:hypothetical protein